MHYSLALKREISVEQTKIERTREIVAMFRAHLCSTKFWNDTTIQVSDVNRWLDCVVRELNGQPEHE